MPTHESGEPIRGNPYRIRDVHASALIEVWLVAAVVTILLIRGYLDLTGYPQVGGGTFHISHMLWGGLGMVVAFGMLIIFAHPVWKPLAALIGGGGFGAFIDELGKFITEDNDYFYQPTIALIYAIFVALFLLGRYLESKREPTTADHLFYTVEGVQWAVIGKLDEHRKEHALEHLEASGATSRITDDLRKILEDADVSEQSEQSRILALRDRMMERYWQIVRNRWLERIAIGFFAFKVIQVLGSLAIGIATDSFVVSDGVSVSEGGAAISALGGSLLAVWGLFRLLQGRRVAALHAFAASVLLSLMFGQFFAFVSDQFFAFGNLIIELVLLGMVRFALATEEESDDGARDVADTERHPETGLGRLF